MRRTINRIASLELRMTSIYPFSQSTFADARRNQKLGHLAKSYAAYERAIALQPNTVTAWQGVVELYKATPEWAILKKHLNELIPKFVTYELNSK
jgi:hypothetical protein